jgi:hypothetical protein
MLTKIRTPYPIFLAVSLMTLILSCRQGSVTSVEVSEVRTPVTVAQFSHKKVISSVKLPAISSFLNKSIIRATTTGIIETTAIVPGEYVNNNMLLYSIRTRESVALRHKSENDTSLTFNGLININSPKTGVISSVLRQNGDYVQEGDELAEVSEQGSLIFILEVPLEYDRYVEKNRICKVLLPDGTEINGMISGRLPEMNIETQTIRYMIKPQSSNRLPANLIGSVTLVVSGNDNALVLPKKAVLSDETQTEFWVMKLINDSIAVKLDITKGFENNEEVEITGSAFLPSDRIIVSGNYGLPDTAKITIIRE